MALQRGRAVDALLAMAAVFESVAGDDARGRSWDALTHAASLLSIDLTPQVFTISNRRVMSTPDGRNASQVFAEAGTATEALRFAIRLRHATEKLQLKEKASGQEILQYLERDHPEHALVLKALLAENLPPKEVVWKKFPKHSRAPKAAPGLF